MPIVFFTHNERFSVKIRNHGFESRVANIQDFIPDESRRTYYVSPANSLCFMDGGIDYALSRIVFPGIEPKVKRAVRELNIQNKIGRYYLPIGSSIILEDTGKFLVVSPTMLLPQDVSGTRNAYYATMATLYNVLVNRGENLDEVDILMTSFCCGYGKMDEDESIQQILEGIRDYPHYNPIIIDENTIVNEPTLLNQPKLYQNTEWFSIHPEEIIRC